MKLLLTVSFLISLTACQNLRHKKSELKWSELNSWSITAKMAITDGQQSGSGKIDWKLSKTNFEARFRAPLGQGSWKLTEERNGARLTSSKHPDKFSTNAQRLLVDELGWSFPLEKLKYWLRGFEYLQTPNEHKKPIDTIDDKEWHINYQKWQHTTMGLLPTKIKASKPPYSVKLIIYHWDFD